MKKWIALLTMGVLVLTAFVGCAPSECEACGKTDVETTKVTVGDESAYVCDSCKAVIDGINAIGDGVSSIGDAIGDAFDGLV